MTAKSRIVEEIRSSGPMPFDRFMEVALYSTNGFFGGDTLRSEKAGDFLTSPEVSPLFGETLAEFVKREHERIGDPFEILEVGAGSGSLIRPLLSTYPVPAQAVEASPAAREVLSAHVKTTEQMPSSVRGVIIANELIDNLPMALSQKVGEGWRERWVGVSGDALVFVDAPPRDDVIKWLEDFAGDVPDGGWVEVQLGAQRWLSEAMKTLQDGSIVVIDYGDTAENLLPRRQDGTLRTYRAHHLGPHPLDEPGETDITADVNFSALLKTAGPNAELFRQDDFLTDLGLRDRLTELRTAELAASRSGDEMERLRVRALKTEAETLLHPRGLGDFRVLVVQK